MSTHSKFLMVATVALLTTVSLSAKVAPSPDDAPQTVDCCGSTSRTDGPRYEILRDVSDGLPCFRLDKYTGEVWSLNRPLASAGNYDICQREKSSRDTVIEGQINYQLIVHSSTHAILMNLNSGEIWEYDTSILDMRQKFKLMRPKK